jgi:hypothetical protein
MRRSFFAAPPSILSTDMWLTSASLEGGRRAERGSGRWAARKRCLCHRSADNFRPPFFYTNQPLARLAPQQHLTCEAVFYGLLHCSQTRYMPRE